MTTNLTADKLYKRYKEILQLRNDGYSINKIGVLYGISKQRVSQILKSPPIDLTGICPTCNKQYDKRYRNQRYCKNCTPGVKQK